MKSWARPYPALAVLAFAACCPTLWLTVTKGPPMPSKHSPFLDSMTGAPIVRPASLTNQILVIQDFPSPAKRVEISPDYTDYFDGQTDPSRAKARALWAMRHFYESNASAPNLLRETGPRGMLLSPLRDTITSVEMTVGCSTQGCLTLTPISKKTSGGCSPPQVTAAVQIRKIDGVEAPADAIYIVTEVHPDGQIVVARPLPAKEGTTVTVDLSSELQLSKTLLSFIHLSDIQLREGSVKLDDPDISRRLDVLVPQFSSFEYDPDLEFYNQYVTAALLATINRNNKWYEDPPASKRSELDPLDRPEFVIHTGDSIDSGVESELHLFHTLIDKVDIPFLELFGNHDTLVFGNLIPAADDDESKCASGDSLAGQVSFPWSTFVPDWFCVHQNVKCTDEKCISGEVELVARTDPAETRKRFIRGVKDVPSDQTSNSPPDLATRDHGFDLNRDLGYYSFSRPIKITTQVGVSDVEAKAIFVALNSEDRDSGQGGIGGRIGKTQFNWLKGILESADTHDLIFVFAHQPVGSIDIDGEIHGTFESLLDSNKHIVGYFYGHNHAHEICGDARNTVCSHFWEVETGSLIEFPQEGRLVRIKQVSTTDAFIEVSTFGEQLDSADAAFARLVELGHRGAERDYCHNHTEVGACSDTLRPYRTDGRETQGRLFFKLPCSQPGTKLPPGCLPNRAAASTKPGPTNENK